ncbi:hypothetical protein AMS68_002771 [Peltaster fructicola]|uniref:Uncharacterized protein n=1 Tax=Peltaster fructicola TaxID=286661 RepID=A0A6H0XR98_9PEZI|nr:hypothetical protein AMS68_002771 [Peltaster fructicola]
MNIGKNRVGCVVFVGGYIGGENILPDLRTVKKDYSKSRPGFTFKESDANFTSPYPIGDTKPPGELYTKTLVIASTKEENTTWIEPELGDMIKSGLLQPAVYVVDDKTPSTSASEQGPRSIGLSIVYHRPL